MLIEILGGASASIFALWQVANYHADKEALLSHRNDGPYTSVAAPVPRLEKGKDPSTDVLNLVFELLRSDDGWGVSNKSMSNSSSKTWLHSTGAKITDTIMDRSGRRYHEVSILDEEGVYQSVELNADDKLLLKKELEAYTTRATDRRQRELARSLAKRIVGGPVPPVLGGTDVPRLPSSRDDDSEQHGASTTGLLSYDPSTKRIVASVRGDNVQLELDASLRDRYAVSKKAGKADYSDLMLRIMEENNLKQYNDMWDIVE